jgi:hypothetical protein
VRASSTSESLSFSSLGTLVWDINAGWREPVERRNFVRYSLRLPIIFKWKDPLGQSQQGAGFSRDISPSGAFVLCAAPPVEGTDFVMEVLLPPLAGSARTGLRLQATGRVIRVELETKEPGFAAASQFTSPAPFDEAGGGRSS